MLTMTKRIINFTMMNTNEIMDDINMLKLIVMLPKLW